MKKVVSMFLVLVIISTIMVPAALADNSFSDNIIDATELIDSAGNVIKFELVENNNNEYTLNYYFNDVLTKTYDISTDQNSILVTPMSSSATQSSYTIAMPESASISGPNELPLRIKDRWFHVGYINYRYSESFDCEPFALLSAQTDGYYSSTYTINTYENSSFSDWVSTITSSLIASGLVSVSPSTIAAALLIDIIALLGGEVINDVISIFFTEEYDCLVTEYILHACVYGDGMGENDTVEYYGTQYYVTYDNAPDRDYYYDGWTPQNWQSVHFAEEIWDDSVPWWPAFPGVDSYTTYR